MTSQCFWPTGCSDSRRCREFGQCVAAWQSANKDKLFAPAQDPSHVRRCSHCDHWAVVERCTICGRESSGDHAGISIEAGYRAEIGRSRGELAAATRVGVIMTGAAGKHAERVVELEAEVSTLRESLAEVNRLLSLHVKALDETRAERDAREAQWQALLKDLHLEIRTVRDERDAAVALLSEDVFDGCRTPEDCAGARRQDRCRPCKAAALVRAIKKQGNDQ